MESHGEAGAVQITDATHALVAHAFQCVDRGTIQVKGRGPMHVWHVVGRIPDVIDLRDSAQVSPGR